MFSYSDSDYYLISLDLALFYIKNAQKHEKNELLSGRQKFVFIWRERRDSFFNFNIVFESSNLFYKQKTPYPKLDTVFSVA